ncbi:MAG TPA: hypothetical protein VFI30_02790, partial [Nocardioidaceae bacterium]|nr:hypothetical protein [Nocardioidaceae bacterium]
MTVVQTVGGPAEEVSGSPTRLWRDAIREVLANRAALIALVLLAVIVLGALLAPLYASEVAHTNPFTSHIGATVELGGKRV